MFDKASLKLGLDKAVLQSMSGRENATNGVSRTGPAPFISPASLLDLNDSETLSSIWLFFNLRFPFLELRFTLFEKNETFV